MIPQIAIRSFGLSRTRNTEVGNEYIRDVSAGKRKSVSIAEMALVGSPIACSDNSTLGLDAATALKLTRSLRISPITRKYASPNGVGAIWCGSSEFIAEARWLFWRRSALILKLGPFSTQAGLPHVQGFRYTA